MCLGNDFFGYDTLSTCNKVKNIQVGLLQIKKLCTAKEAFKKVKIFSHFSLQNGKTLQICV